LELLGVTIILAILNTAKTLSVYAHMIVVHEVPERHCSDYGGCSASQSDV